jgi:uncharacterized protein
LAADWQDRFA